MTTMPARLWPALLLLGFASGMPLLLVDATFSTWLKQAGWSDEALVYAGFVSLPYVFKVVWAPVIDLLVPPFLGRRRGWLMISQLVIIVGLVAMACFDPTMNPGLLLAAATVTAFASATQDLATNGYTIDAVPPDRLAGGVGLWVWGYRVAMVIAGGQALVLAGEWGWSVAYLVMAALLIPGVVGTLMAPEPIGIAPPQTWRSAIVDPFKDFMHRLGVNGLVLLLVLVLLYRLTDGLANMLSGPFLIEMEYDLTSLGHTRSVVGLIGAAIGAGVATWGCIRIGVMPCMWLFGILQAISNLGFVGIEQGWWGGIPGLIGVLLFDTACGAAAGTTFVAWLMGFCSLSLSATQYALLTAITVLGPHMLRPFIAEHIGTVGWSGYFVFTTLAMIPGLLLLIPARRLPRRTVGADEVLPD